MKLVVFLSACLAACAAPASPVLFLDGGPAPAGFESVPSIQVGSWRALDAACVRLGARPGAFPALVGGGGAWVAVRPGEGKASALARLAADESARSAQVSVAFREAKSPGLRAAERKLVEFWRAEGAVPAGAVSATADQLDAMVANWEATLNDTQLEKKSAKYERLLRAVERRGGNELDAHWQE